MRGSTAPRPQRLQAAAASDPAALLRRKLAASAFGEYVEFTMKRQREPTQG
jgi:hypothetical protein